MKYRLWNLGKNEYHTWNGEIMVYDTSLIEDAGYLYDLMHDIYLSDLYQAEIDLSEEAA